MAEAGSPARCAEGCWAEGRELEASASCPAVAAEGLCQGREVTGHFLSKVGVSLWISGNVAQIQPQTRLLHSSFFS